MLILIRVRDFPGSTFRDFYLSLLLYKNPLRDIIFLQKDPIVVGDIVWLVYYIGIHYTAIHYFLTAGANPGFLDETETPKERELRHSLMGGSGRREAVDSDGDADEENIGFGISSRVSDGAELRTLSKGRRQEKAQIDESRLIVDQSTSIDDEHVQGDSEGASRVQPRVTTLTDG